MATIVCQGLQSCLESQIVESRTLRLRLSSPKPHFSQSLELALKPSCLDYSSTKELSERSNHDEHKQTSSSSIQNPDMGGWSFLQVLPNTSLVSKEPLEKENVYVHPLVKRHSSTLSEKSLELCTESLGSETGTVDTIESGIFTSSLSSFVSSESHEVENSPTREQEQQQQQQQQQKPRQLLGAKKGNHIRSFPPPLTTMSGPESLQFRPHREDGRLIIKAVKAPSKNSYFQAERSEGRLRLSFVQNSASNFDLDGENEATSVRSKNDEQDIESDAMNSDETEQVEQEELQDVEPKKENGHAYFGKEMDGNNIDIGAEIGKEEFQRPRRCKEGELDNKGLLNWEPFWVATS